MRSIKILNDLADTIIELVFPAHCIVCRNVIEFKTDKWLCPECKGKIRPIDGKICDICGVPINVDGICSNCRKKKFYFKRAYCAYEYKNEVRKAIHNIKFNGCYNFIGFFVDRSVSNAKDHGFEGADIVVPVPMRRRDLNKRGYNQSAVFAKLLSKCGMGRYADVLKKIRKTKNQHDIADKKEREKNIKNAFAVKKAELVKGKKVLLVDDIFTTGSTANECSKALMRAGAAVVEVLCIAVVSKEH